MKRLTRRRFVANSLGYATSLFSIGLCGDAFSKDKEDALGEEQELKAKAAYTLVFGSPYDTANADYSPHMHVELKRNVQRLSDGKIYVDIRDKGTLGIGPELMASVVHGQINAALISVSNLSPAVPELDILNIPFWSADNQSYLNLVTSKVWDDLIWQKIRQTRRVDLLFHYVVGPRTLSTTKTSARKIIVPEDIQNDDVVRVPSSGVLHHFYKMAGARPRPIAWGRTAFAAREKAFVALDPSIVGLFNGPDNLKDEISFINQIQSVHDGWVSVVNKNWIASLPISVRESLLAAAELTFKQHLIRTREINRRCIERFEQVGTKVYLPSPDEKQHWIDKCGHQNEAWSKVKEKILGDKKTFDHLLAATKTNNGYAI